MSDQWECPKCGHRSRRRDLEGNEYFVFLKGRGKAIPCTRCGSAISVDALLSGAYEVGSAKPEAKFTCTKCGHLFGQDNPSYPRGQATESILHRDIKCAKCGATIVEMQGGMFWAALMFSSFGAILGGIASGIFSLEGYGLLTAGCVLGAVSGPLIISAHRARLRRCLLEIATQEPNDVRSRPRAS